MQGCAYTVLQETEKGGLTVHVTMPKLLHFFSMECFAG